MALLPYSQRREMEEHRFNPAVSLLIPLIAIFLQAYLPLRFQSFAVLDLPLLVVIYFAVSRRNAIAGTFIGLLVGIIQDSLTHLPLGVHGIIDSIIGYLAASIGLRVDVDSAGTRLLMNFTFVLFASILHVLIARHLLGIHEEWYWIHGLMGALVNALVAVVLFGLLDRLRKRD